MELWIKSQDKKRLMKVDEIWVNEAGTIFCNNTIYASYSEKRALEVLDEIQKKINLINLGHDFGSPMIDLNNPTYIYEMPKE